MLGCSLGSSVGEKMLENTSFQMTVLSGSRKQCKCDSSSWPKVTLKCENLLGDSNHMSTQTPEAQSTGAHKDDPRLGVTFQYCAVANDEYLSKWHSIKFENMDHQVSRCFCEGAGNFFCFHAWWEWPTEPLAYVNVQPGVFQGCHVGNQNIIAGARFTMHSPNGRKSCECMGGDDIKCYTILGASPENDPKTPWPETKGTPRSAGKGVKVTVPKQKAHASTTSGAIQTCEDSLGETWPLGTIIVDDYMCRKSTCSIIEWTGKPGWVDQATCRLENEYKCWLECDLPVVPGKCDKWCKHLPATTSTTPTLGSALGASAAKGDNPKPRSKGDGVKIIVPKNPGVKSMPGGYGYCYDNFGNRFTPGTIIQDPTMCRDSTCTFLQGSGNVYFWQSKATCELQNRQMCWQHCDYPTISGQCDSWCRHVFAAAAPRTVGGDPTNNAAGNALNDDQAPLAAAAPAHKTGMVFNACAVASREYLPKW